MVVPIVISSCDAYQDAWAPFFALFFRYWPDCPFTLYLISNHIAYADERVSSIRVGADRGWASNALTALSRLHDEYLIYLQEDYFITRPVESQRMLDLLDFACAQQAACLRLYPTPEPELPFSDRMRVGEIARDAPYRVSLQAAIWNKEILTSLLVEGETGWDMEIKGTERSRDLAVPFLSVKDLRDPAIPYLRRTAILKGRWTEEAVELCRAEGISLDTSRRPVGVPPIVPVAITPLPLYRRAYRKLRRMMGKATRMK